MQHDCDLDVADKHHAQGIDDMAHQLRNRSCKIGFHPGVEKQDNTFVSLFTYLLTCLHTYFLAERWSTQQSFYSASALLAIQSAVGLLARGILSVRLSVTFRYCVQTNEDTICLLYTSPSPRDRQKSRMPSSA